MKIFICFILITVLESVAIADAPPNRDITYQVSEILKECEKIKPGVTTRAELMENFGGEGGLSSASDRTYVSKRCPYVKIDVKFILAKPEQRDELPTDTIQAVSKPYLAWTVSD